MAAYPVIDEVFKALADPSRRALLDRLNERGGQSLRELCSGLDMARQSVSKHLAVLEAAGLVTTVRRGREKLHHLNAAPIHDIADRWIRPYDRNRAAALADLRRALEDDMPTESTFTYTTYIHTTPEKLWRALTEPEFTRRYWNNEFVTDWQPGSPLVWVYDGLEMSDPQQTVLEADPPRRLAYTWHGISRAFAQKVGLDVGEAEMIDAEPRTHVTFDIEPAEGDLVKLTVVHTGAPGSSIVGMVAEGWPALLSELKTLLEAAPAVVG
jgi:DNA-binding transcriptional ArsR family regulator/uncharacterized protein YndB with AHSA1/START domain